MKTKELIRSNVRIETFPILFFGGCALLTLRNNEKGTHITINVKQHRDKKDRKIKLPIFSVYISLLGDGKTGFSYGGRINSETMELRHSGNPDSRIGKVMSFLKAALKRPELLREMNVSLFHEGKCARCGITLTNPLSLDTGFGDDCRAHIAKSMSKDLESLFFLIEKK